MGKREKEEVSEIVQNKEKNETGRGKGYLFGSEKIAGRNKKRE